MLSLDKIYHAAFILKSVARKTDLIAAPHLSEGNNLYLKTENLQVTGSFKVRGAYYKISQLTPEEAPLITFTIFKADGHFSTQRPQPTQENMPLLFTG